MTREEKKQYLYAYLDLKRDVERLAEEYHFWEDKSKSIPISRLEKSGVHGNRKKSKSVKYIDKHIHICQTIAKLQEEAEQKLQEILTAINSVKNSNQRSVLKYRFVSGYTLYRTSREMHYTIDHIKTLERQGIDNLTPFNTWK